MAKLISEREAEVDGGVEDISTGFESGCAFYPGKGMGDSIVGMGC